jgi:hypothetical protein
MTYAMIDTYYASYKRPPRVGTLDIDETLDVVHGHQNSRCSMLITMNGAFCRSTSTTPRHIAPLGCAVADRHDAVRRRNPRPSATPGAPAPQPVAQHKADHPRRQPLRPSRGDGVVRGQWCRLHFGLPGNAVVDRLTEPAADNVRVRRAQTQAPAVRRYCETHYGAKCTPVPSG